MQRNPLPSATAIIYGKASPLYKTHLRTSENIWELLRTSENIWEHLRTSENLWYQTTSSHTASQICERLLMRSGASKSNWQPNLTDALHHCSLFDQEVFFRFLISTLGHFHVCHCPAFSTVLSCGASRARRRRRRKEMLVSTSLTAGCLPTKAFHNNVCTAPSSRAVCF